MGTILRFLAGAAGLLFLALALGIVAPPLVDLLADPWDVDLPGGAVTAAVMLLFAGSVPCLLGVYLLRKAFRGGAGAGRVDAGRPPALEPEPVAASQPVPPEPAPTQAAVADRSSTAPAIVIAETPIEARPRPWL